MLCFEEGSTNLLHIIAACGAYRERDDPVVQLSCRLIVSQTLHVVM
jgi:hypothetical protein